MSAKEREPIFGMYRDQIKITGDIMSPVVPLEDWEAISNPDRVLETPTFRSSGLGRATGGSPA